MRLDTGNAAEPEERQINWPLSVKALVAALALVGMSMGYHISAPLYGAALIAGWTAFTTLQLTRWLFSPRVWRWGLLAISRLAALAAVAFGFAIAVNSPLPAVAFLGNLLFLGLTVLLGAVTAGYLGKKIWLGAPSVWSAVASFESNARNQLRWVVIALRP